MKVFAEDENYIKVGRLVETPYVKLLQNKSPELQSKKFNVWIPYETV